jgi:hypothetical protein
MKLQGYDAIGHAEQHGMLLSKYNDPIEDAREGLTVEEAREVAAQDPSLIYLNLGLTKRTGPCDEDLFWEAVADLDWATHSKQPRGYNYLKRQVLAYWDREFICGFQDLMHIKLGELSAAIERWENANDKQLPCGDDGFSDLKHHILGLGREVFEAEKADPALAAARASKYDYVESFGYAIPYRSELPKDMSMEEARAKVRAQYTKRDGRALSDDEVEREALNIKYGASAQQMPEYYAAWARMEVGFVGQILDSPFAEEVGMERVARLEGSLHRMGRGEVAALDFDLLRQELKEIREQCGVIYRRETAKLEVLTRRETAKLGVLTRQGRGWALENLLSNAQDNFGSKEVLDSASPSV